MKKVFSRFVTLLGLGSFLGTQANSAIVYSSIETVLNRGDSWDIDADGTSDTTFMSQAATQFIINRDHIDFIRAGTTGSRELFLQSLARNFNVGSILGNYAWAEGVRNRLDTSSSTRQFDGGLADNISSYIGFRFDGDRTTSGRQNLYGWARVTYVSRSSLTIHEWAYEDVPGEAIAVGIIPEPTSASLGLLALGAVGLRRWRKGTA